ncbi:Monocarboxylate transporter 12, partial [Armadillidium nasatum]
KLITIEFVSIHFQSELAEDEDGSLYHKFTPRATGPVPEEEDEDNASVLSLPAELPPPPDGGWGWMIVFVSFLANLIVDGVAYSFSPFLDTFSTYFEEPKGKVAWISSLLAGMYLSVGPIVSALTNKFGCRPVCIAGAVIASLAYASTVFATSVPYLMVTQGCIAGFGFGLIYLPAVVAVGYYFESKRALATGIAVCGSGVGTMIFPPLWMGALMRPLEVPKMKKKDLLHRLAEEKKLAMEAGSFYGSNYMNSDGTVVRKRVVNYDPGVHSHLNLSGYLTPAGTSLALPTIQEDDKDSLVDNSSVKGTVVSPTDTQKMPRNSSQPSMNKNGVQVPKRASVPNFERRMSRLDMVNQMKVVPATPEASYTNLRSLASQDGRRTSVGRVFSASSFGDPETVALRQRRSSKDKKGVMLPPMSRQDIFYSGSIKNLNEFKSQASMLSYRESTFNLQNTSASRAVLEAFDGGDDQSSDESEDKKCFPDDLCSPFREMMDFSLLKNPCFLVVGIANMIGMLGFYTPFVYLPGAAIEKGIDKDSATLLVSIIGITNTIGRVLSGLIADIPKVDPLWVNNLSIIFSGVCMFLTPFANSFGSFVAIAVFFGFFV